MSDWFLETGLYLLGVALIPAVGLLLVCWGLWGDRSKGRPRCPRCWYDMRGTVPSLVCPECGHGAKQERRLYRNRCRWRRVALGVSLVLVFSYPLTIVGGWYREQSSIRILTTPMLPGVTIGLIRTGPDWLVGRLPKRFAQMFDRVGRVRLARSATDVDLAECRKLWHLQDLGMSIFSSGLQHTGVQVTDAGLVHLKGLSRLRFLSLNGTQVTDAGLLHLQGLSQLYGLDLSHTHVTDAGLVHLKEHLQLRYLELSGTQVTDAGLAHVAALSDLRQLRLTGEKVTDAGLVHLKGLSQLQEFGLSDTQVTDAGLVHLKRLSDLVQLSLSGAQVTDAGLVHLKGLSQLEDLDLSGTQMTDAGLVHLKGLSQLRYLDLYATQVTDAGLVHLKGLPIHELGLSGTQVTDAGEVVLKQALPNVWIHRNARYRRYNSWPPRRPPPASP